ncbi:MAG TPA: hypothetical protein VKD90_25870 [Gemmataceae bacterium]|nr:hypothetical protein [Gemmataceae bacterium]
MTAEVSPPARRSFLRVGVADFVFVFFALAILQRAGSGIVDDPGLGWHIRIADAMTEKGGFLDSDPFGQPTRGEPWVPFGFLGSAALRLADGWGGLDALAMLAALTIAFTLRCLYRMMVTDGVPPVQAVAWTFLAALGVSTAWVARPNVFTLLFFLVTARVCVQWHRDRISARKTLWLLPLFAVWANTHGGWAAGLLTIAGAGLAELGLAAWDRGARPAALGRFRWFVLLGAGCGLATLVNPSGPRMHLQVLRLMGDPFMMNLNDDWLSWDFHALGSFRLELLILLLPLLLAWSRYRPDAVSLALAVLWLHLGLNGRRYAPLWVLVTVPTLARLTAQLPVVERVGEWLSEKHPDVVPPASPSRSRAPWLWTAVAAVVLFGSTRYYGGYARHHPDDLPAPALDKLLEVHQGEKVFHSINWGGYLTWHGWNKDPRFLVWIDDRNELYGRERIEEWMTISAARPGWREALERHGFGLICVPKESGLAYRLAEEPGWERLYADDAAVIYRRARPGPIDSPSGRTHP